VKRRLAVHLSVWIVGAAVLRVVVVPTETCPPVTADELRTTISETIDWITRGVGDDGRYLYGYDLEADQIAASYNSARHAGVTMSLYQAYEALGDPAILSTADGGLDYMLARTTQHDDWMAWGPAGTDLPVGANGLFLAGLALRRRATGDPVHDDVIRGVAGFLVQQQESSGAVRAYWDRSDAASVPGVYGPFATGEAAWALVLTGVQFPDEEWLDAALLTVDYIAEERDLAEGYLARLPDHWAAYAVGDLPADELNDTRIGLARRLAGYFGMRLRFEAQRTGEGINLWVRWYPGPPAGVGTAGEGIAALRDLAIDDPRMADLRSNIEDRMICTAGIMAERQVGEEEASVLPRPDLARGAWFYRGYTQMDGQQHVLSALLGALEILEEEAA
jgi:hypothetical protein